MCCNLYFRWRGGGGVFFYWHKQNERAPFFFILIIANNTWCCFEKAAFVCLFFVFSLFRVEAVLKCIKGERDKYRGEPCKMRTTAAAPGASLGLSAVPQSGRKRSSRRLPASNGKRGERSSSSSSSSSNARRAPPAPPTILTTLNIPSASGTDPFEHNRATFWINDWGDKTRRYNFSKSAIDAAFSSLDSLQVGNEDDIKQLKTTGSRGRLLLGIGFDAVSPKDEPRKISGNFGSTMAASAAESKIFAAAVDMSAPAPVSLRDIKGGSKKEEEQYLKQICRRRLLRPTAWASLMLCLAPRRSRQTSFESC